MNILALKNAEILSLDLPSKVESHPPSTFHILTSSNSGCTISLSLFPHHTQHTQERKAILPTASHLGLVLLLKIYIFNTSCFWKMQVNTQAITGWCWRTCQGSGSSTNRKRYFVLEYNLFNFIDLILHLDFQPKPECQLEKSKVKNQS